MASPSRSLACSRGGSLLDYTDTLVQGVRAPDDYTTPRYFSTYSGPAAHRVSVWLSVATGKDFGETGDVSVALSRSTYVQTNIKAFPWNRILVNGKPLPTEREFLDDKNTLGFSGQ